MNKRTRSVSIAIAMLTASSWFAFDANAAGSSSSRSCLTSAARSLLSRIEQKFGSVNVVSTCRPGARIAGSGRVSRHASGNAVDFEAGGRKGAIVSWLVANHRSGGTMTYSGSGHVHVDIGQHFVSLAGGSGKRVASRSTQRVASRSTYKVASRSSHRMEGRMSLGGPRKARDRDDD